MKELITRDSVMKEVEECFKQLNRQIEEHCVMHDSVLARSKCLKARNMLNKQLMEIKTVAIEEELLEKETMPEFCTGCRHYLPRIDVERNKSMEGGYGELSNVTCVHAEFCKYQHERFANASVGSRFEENQQEVGEI